MHLLVIVELIRNVIREGDRPLGHQSSLDGSFVLRNVGTGVSKFGVHFGF
jgi:hypothetical protein